jgi:hypothetical protein
MQSRKANRQDVDLVRDNSGVQQLLSDSLDRVLTWARGQDYVGHSKFDLFNTPLIDRLTPRVPIIRTFMSAAWARSPINLRSTLGTTRSRNPKGIALFALAYLRRYRVSGAQGDLEEAERLLAWLGENAAQGHSGLCWGYDHEWNNLHFTAPKHSANLVVTGNVAYALLDAFETTLNQRYLEMARSSVEYFLQDLGCTVDTPEMRDISYVPGATWTVLNNAGLAAAILVRVARHTGEQQLIGEARRLISFLVDKQTDYGAWHYAWPASTSNVKHDSYHTGNVLDWILDYTVATGDDTFQDSFRRGIEFYREHLFHSDGFPKWRHTRSYPADVHSAAQGVVTFAKAAAELDDSYLEHGRRVALWAIRNLQHRDGFFFYQKGRFRTRRFTLMRWCNSWMAYALASLLLAEQLISERRRQDR